jgi:hypothetical protein
VFRSSLVPGTGIKLFRSLSASWANVRETRSLVSAALEGFPAPVRHATMMVASELLENALKYGEAVTLAPDIAFTLLATTDSIEVEVRNGCTQPSQLDDLQQHVRDIMSAEDKAALHFARLRQLAKNRGESNKLGVYRMVYEGEFELAVCVEADVVTVRARRALR